MTTPSTPYIVEWSQQFRHLLHPAIETAHPAVPEFMYRAGRFYTNSAWLSIGPLRVYVRKSVRKPQGTARGTRITCFDIGNVAVMEQVHKRGIFSSFLTYLEALKPWDGIYVENVTVDFLEKHLVKRGYVPQRQTIEFITSYLYQYNQRTPTV